MMTLWHTARDLLGEFGRRHGLDITLEEGGVCLLGTAHGLDLQLVPDEMAGCLRALAVIALEPEVEQRAGLYAALLNANLFGAVTGGGSLALHPDSGDILYQHAYALENADPDSFAAFFAVVCEAACALREACRKIVEGENHG
ncbi:MAG: type III secretion system chaperone [Deltaproteobacteria bacterium]|jgi:hypothetical protein|nr:type III secretion system chaperone [Deltaproteobacteria bacterium]